MFGSTYRISYYRAAVLSVLAAVLEAILRTDGDHESPGARVIIWVFRYITTGGLFSFSFLKCCEL